MKSVHTPGAEARILGDGERPKAEALGYIQARTSNGKGNYGDSGFARMTTRTTTRTKAGTNNDKQQQILFGNDKEGSELR